MIDAGSDILKSKAKLIECPILFSHGDADPINAYPSSVKACELASSKDKEMKGWPGLYHECMYSLNIFYFSFFFFFLVQNETFPEREQVSNYYIKWIKDRCPSA